MSSQDELNVTEHFVKHLSEATSSKYLALAEQEENSDADTWVKEPDENLIPVQNVTSEGTTLKMMVENTRAFHRGQPLRVEPVEQDKWITSVLAAKEAKHYSDASNIVLLLQGSLPYPTPEQVLALLPIESSFAGVYYVAPPSSSYPEGYVVCMKPYWETSQTF
jgi:hypothetical protein